MAQTSPGIGGLTYDPAKKARPPELNVLLALVLITVAFELIGRVFLGDSFLFNTRENVDSIFNWQRLNIIILQVSIVGIIALGVTQVIISGGIDLSSGSIVGATAMIAMSFAQTELVNGNPNPKAIFGDWAMDLPVLIPVLAGLGCGLVAGFVNGALIAYTRIPPFIATLGMMVFARGLSRWWSNGNPVSFPTEGYATIGKGMIPVVIFVSLAILLHLILNHTKYGKHCYAVGSNEQASRISGIETVFQNLALADDLDVPSNLFLGREKFLFKLGPFSILDKKAMREATIAALEKTAVKIPNLMNTIRNMSGGQRQCVAIARTAAFKSKLVIMDEPTAALGVQETAQVENIIRTLKAAGEPLILISHNMRQVFDLVDRVVVFRRGRIVANLRKEETNGQDVVSYITGAKTGSEYEGAA
jgi:ribose/xylose/arabinose/galactoside ABC-type transport system permease subunit/ABC-type lipopolysaccharide export system ATPase subunit